MCPNRYTGMKNLLTGMKNLPACAMWIKQVSNITGSMAHYSKKISARLCTSVITRHYHVHLRPHKEKGDDK